MTRDDYRNLAQNLVSAAAGAALASPLGPVAGLVGALGGSALYTALAPSHTPGMLGRRLVRVPALREAGVHLAIKKKLRIDFRHSALRTPSLLEVRGGESQQQLFRTRILRRSSRDGRVALADFPVLPAAVWRGEIDPIALGVVRGAGPIAVNCASIECGALATLKSLVKRHGLDLAIDYRSITGREQLERAVCADTFDFMIVSDAAFFMFPASCTKHYRKLFTCHSEPQHFYGSAKANGARRRKAYVYPASSAEQHYRATEDRHLEMVPMDMLDVTDLANNLEDGAVIVAREPLSTRLAWASPLRAVADSEYEIWASFFCHRRWRGAARRTLLRSFISVLVAEWNYCASHQRYAGSLLLEDEDLVKYFTFGCGLN